MILEHVSVSEMILEHVSGSSESVTFVLLKFCFTLGVQFWWSWGDDMFGQMCNVLI